MQKFVEQKTCELFKIMLVHRQKLHRVRNTEIPNREFSTVRGCLVYFQLRVCHLPAN